MYHMHIWDTDEASKGRNGSVRSVAIPLSIAQYLFGLPAERFPILSSLSFDDYDLFSDVELNHLINELIDAARVNPGVSEHFDLMVGITLDAKRLGKKVLFDPFSANKTPDR